MGFKKKGGVKAVFSTGESDDEEEEEEEKKSKRLKKEKEKEEEEEEEEEEELSEARQATIRKTMEWMQKNPDKAALLQGRSR